MKKPTLALAFLLGNLAFLSLFTEITQGSDGVRLSGGGCGRLESTPVQNDSDKDGVADPFDNCPSSFNPHQNDEDGNGIGEICEVVEPFDGQLDCSFPSCNDADECYEFLADACPADNVEAGLLGLDIACCDQACTVLESGEEGPRCPDGACFSPSIHCLGDEECIAAGFQFCSNGCCVGEAPLPCGPCECPPEEPECLCPPPCPEGPPPPPPPPTI